MGSEGCGWGDLSRGATPPWLWELLLGSWVKITTMMLTKVTVPSRRRMWHGAPGRLRGARLAMTTRDRRASPGRSLRRWADAPVRLAVMPQHSACSSLQMTCSAHSSPGGCGRAGSW